MACCKQTLNSSSLTCINQRLDTMSSKIMLILPPSTKESDFDVNESSSVIFLQLIKDSVKNVLDTSLLNVIPRW